MAAERQGQLSALVVSDLRAQSAVGCSDWLDGVFSCVALVKELMEKTRTRPVCRLLCISSTKSISLDARWLPISKRTCALSLTISCLDGTIEQCLYPKQMAKLFNIALKTSVIGTVPSPSVSQSLRYPGGVYCFSCRCVENRLRRSTLDDVRQFCPRRLPHVRVRGPTDVSEHPGWILKFSDADFP